MSKTLEIIQAKIDELEVDELKDCPGYAITHYREVIRALGGKVLIDVGSSVEMSALYVSLLAARAVLKELSPPYVAPEHVKGWDHD